MYEKDLEVFKVSQLITTNYGRTCRTVRNKENDLIFLKNFCHELNRMKIETGARFSHSTDDQMTFLTYVENALLFACLDNKAVCKVFSYTKDHFERPMRRYIIEHSDGTPLFIVDAYATLDVQLQISKIKRFWLTHIPRSMSHVDESKFVPRIHYVVKLWTTPCESYAIEFETVPMPITYSSKVETMRKLIGFPNYHEEQEMKCYERSDYELRRALFHESTGVLKK